MIDLSSSQDWIGNLPENLRQSVLDLMPVRRYANGDMVYRAHEPGDELYQVVSGNIRIFTLTEDGRELLYDLFASGTCFGETSLIDGGTRAHNVQAIGAVELRVLSRTDFQRLWRDHHEVSCAIAQLICYRQRKLYGIYERVSLNALSKRMAGRLCTLAASMGQNQSDGVHFGMRITQEDIGSLVAGSRQSVNKILKQWQCNGVIDIAYGSLVIKDLPVLEQLATDSA